MWRNSTPTDQSHQTPAGPSQPTTAGPSQPTAAGPSQPTSAGPSQPTPASQPTTAGPSQPTPASQPTSAGPSQPTSAEPSQSTLAGPRQPTPARPPHPTPTAPLQPAVEGSSQPTPLGPPQLTSADPSQRTPARTTQQAEGSASTPPGERDEEPSVTVERLIWQFEEALQGPGELYEAFMGRLRTLAESAFCDEPQRIRRRRVLWRFIAGLWDHDLAERIKQHNWLRHRPSNRQMTHDQLIRLTRSLEATRGGVAEGHFKEWPAADFMRHRATLGARRARIRLGKGMPLPPIPGEALERPGEPPAPGIQERRPGPWPVPRHAPGRSATAPGRGVPAAQRPPGDSFLTLAAGGVRPLPPSGPTLPPPAGDGACRPPPSGHVPPSPPKRSVWQPAVPGKRRNYGHVRTGEGVDETTPNASSSQMQQGAVTSTAPGALPEPLELAVVPSPQPCGTEAEYETITVTGESTGSPTGARGADGDKTSDATRAANAENPTLPAADAGDGPPGQDARQQLQSSGGRQPQEQQGSAQHQPLVPAGGEAATEQWGASASVNPAQARENVAGGHAPTLGAIESAIQEHVRETRREQLLRDLRSDRLAREVYWERFRQSRSRTRAQPRSRSPPTRSRSPAGRPASVQIGNPVQDPLDQAAPDINGSTRALCSTPMDSAPTLETPSQAEESNQPAGAPRPSSGASTPLLSAQSSAPLRQHSQSPSNLRNQSPVTQNPIPAQRCNKSAPMDLSRTSKSSDQTTAMPNPATGDHDSSPPVPPHFSVTSSDKNISPSRAPSQRPVRRSSRTPPRPQSPGLFLFSQYISLASVGQAVGLPPLLPHPSSQLAGSTLLSVDPHLTASHPVLLSPLSPVSQGVMPSQSVSNPSQTPPRPQSVTPRRPSPLLHNLVPPLPPPPPPPPAPHSSTLSHASHSAQSSNVLASAPSLPTKGAIARPTPSHDAVSRSSPDRDPDSDEGAPNTKRKRLTRAMRNSRREQRLNRVKKLKEIAGNGKEAEGGAGAASADMDIWKDYRGENDTE